MSNAAAAEETETEGTEEPTAEAAPEDAKPEGPVVVTEVDRLKAENVNLRLQSAVHKETLAQLAAQKAAEARVAAQQETIRVRVELEEKYGVNLQTHLIDEHSGEVRPRNGGVPPQLQAMMGQGGRG